MSTKKYRPYFTLAELRHIATTLRLTHVPNSPHFGLNLGIIQYLEKYIRDIEDGFRQENHTMKPSLIERLESSAEVCEDDFAAIEQTLSKRIPT